MQHCDCYKRSFFTVLMQMQDRNARAILGDARRASVSS